MLVPDIASIVLIFFCVVFLDINSIELCYMYLNSGNIYFTQMFCDLYKYFCFQMVENVLVGLNKWIFFVDQLHMIIICSNLGCENWFLFINTNRGLNPIYTLLLLFLNSFTIYDKLWLIMIKYLKTKIQILYWIKGNSGH